MLETIQSRRKGFTVLEILVVIVVVVILALLIVPNLISGPARARDSIRKNDMRDIKAALESFYNDTGAYPTALSQLEDGAVPYMKDVPEDPKTQEAYIYITEGSPPFTFTITAILENENDRDVTEGTKNSYLIKSSN